MAMNTMVESVKHHTKNKQKIGKHPTAQPTHFSRPLHDQWSLPYPGMSQLALLLSNWGDSFREGNIHQYIFLQIRVLQD